MPDEKAPPRAKKSAVKNDGRSQLKDIVPSKTLHALQTLHWRLEREEAARRERP